LGQGGETGEKKGGVSSGAKTFSRAFRGTLVRARGPACWSKLLPAGYV